jgi:hypothetical protein
MIDTLLYSLIGTGIIFLILKLANIAYKHTLIPVEKVDAGTAKKHIPPSYSSKTGISESPETRTTKASYTISPFESFYHNGKKVNPKNYIITRVDGNCMVPRNIHTGDLLFIEKFDGNSDSLSTGDILFIQREEGGFKIREYREKDPNDDKRVKTILYQENGTPKDSSEPHKLSNIKGVVRMRFAVN